MRRMQEIQLNLSVNSMNANKLASDIPSFYSEVPYVYDPHISRLSLNTCKYCQSVLDINLHIQCNQLYESAVVLMLK